LGEDAQGNLCDLKCRGWLAVLTISTSPYIEIRGLIATMFMILGISTFLYDLAFSHVGLLWNIHCSVLYFGPLSKD